MGRYFKNTFNYFHEQKVSENTKCESKMAFTIWCYSVFMYFFFPK